MTASPSDPWAAAASQPDDPWSVPSPYSTPPGGRPPMPASPTSAPTGSQPTEPHPSVFPPTEPLTPTSAQPNSAAPGSAAPGSGLLGPGSLVPASVPPAQPGGPVIVQIAEIAVTSTTVYTPTGDIPLSGSQWQVNDYWFSQQRIPKWAIVMAIAGFCVLTVFSLLFLLVKETVMQGTVQVTVTNGTRQYVARIPVTDQTAVTAINQQVNYVRTLAAL
jgi:hypothetical protein